MMLKTFIGFLLWLMALQVSAQKFVSERGVITFFSSATLEDISAKNSKISSIINVSTFEVAFSVPIDKFQFEKKLMQQHFNERYMESDKFPKSTFVGRIDGFDATSSAVQKVKVIGKLSIHGVTNEVSIPGTIEMTPTTLTAKAKFIIKLADYNVEIPQLLWQNIAEQVEVTVELYYKPQTSL
jgi:polyisoprenoid-binding protein YceI